MEEQNRTQWHYEQRTEKETTEPYMSGTERGMTDGDTGKKKHSMAKGVLCGVLGTVIAGWVVLTAVYAVTGKQLIFWDNNSAGKILDGKAVSKISELGAYINAYYYDDTDTETLQDGLYAGLLEGLGDKYSVYYNEEAYQQTQVSTTGQYYGIGAGLTQDPDTMIVSVSKVYEGTPSEEAGLLAEDVIMSVDGTEGDSMEVTELVKLIRGEEGTKVHLEVYRPSTGENLAFDVERKNITLPSVSHEMLEDQIGYIAIESFETETALQFETALQDLESQGMQSLIIDLRYNGGGLVDSVVQILDDILPEGLLVYVEDKAGNRKDYTSSGDSYIDYPMAVLVNQDSASASEIFAGAIKDYGYGTLIGTTTYGKGIVQTIFPLEDGDAVKLTTAKYFTPKGNYIHGVGIEPDIELEYEYMNPDGEVYEKQYDNQLQKAIEVLKEERQ